MTAWILELMKSKPELRVRVDFTAFVSDLAGAGFVESLKIVIDQRANLGISDEEFGGMLECALEDAFENYQTETAKLILRHRPWSKLNVEEFKLIIGKLCESMGFEVDKIRISNGINFLMFLMAELPKEYLTSLLPTSPEAPRTVLVWQLINLGSVEIFKLLAEKGYRFHPYTVSYYCSFKLSKQPWIVPPEALEVVNYLIETYGFRVCDDVFVPCRDFRLEYSLFRTDSVQYLDFITKHYGDTLFKTIDDAFVFECLDYAETDRFASLVPLDVFVRQFEFVFRRSGLKWKPLYTNAVKKLTSKMVREAFETVLESLQGI